MEDRYTEKQDALLELSTEEADINELKKEAQDFNNRRNLRWLLELLEQTITVVNCKEFCMEVE